MTFLAQHGYGKAQKLEALRSTGNLSGVILSPADEDPANLSATAQWCRTHGLRVLVDPQSYIYSSSPQGSGRNHEAHGINFESLHWSEDARAVTHQIQSVGRLNDSLNRDGDWIAPSVSQSSFADIWTPLALQLARTAAEEWGREKTIASVVVDEGGYSVWSNVDDWLDVASTLPVKGYYLLVGRGNASSPPVAWAPKSLANVMGIIHNLGVLNGYEVSWGFSDAEGLLGLAAGATSNATGWSFGLRQFSTNKWVPTKGGRPAIVRMPLPRLWASLRAPEEVRSVWNSAFRDEAFGEELVREFESRSFESITRSEAQDRYLAAISANSVALGALTHLPERLDVLELSLSRALELHQRIEQAGIVLESRYRPRVVALLEALRIFRSTEKL